MRATIVKRKIAQKCTKFLSYFCIKFLLTKWFAGAIINTESKEREENKMEERITTVGELIDFLRNIPRDIEIENCGQTEFINDAINEESDINPYEVCLTVNPCHLRIDIFL